MKPVTDILPFIPQRPPFVMIQELIACDENSAMTTLVVKEENIFTKNGLLGEPALVENIAQTAAARIGYICQQENKPVPIGYIAAVQNLVIFRLPNVGYRLKTEIVIKNQVMHVTIISGTVKINDEVIAGCEMKIFISNANS